ncbi:MAG TPA: fibronectin type III domain-containing protein, partial [Bacteroidota bacterium]|nr:fibronectin type III domain-containing protein [Bacteroidota bacterium]
MKKLLSLLALASFCYPLYSQSQVTIGPSASVSVGSGANVGASNRNGTMSGVGSFNNRSIVFDPSTSAASAVTTSSFNANWTLSGGATGYYLDVSTNANFSSYLTGYQALDVGNASSLSVSSGLSSGTTYYYRVRAYDVDGVTGYSNITTVTTAPSSPVASAATSISTTTFTANWSAVAGATIYYLDIATDNGFTSLVTGWSNVNVGNVTSYTVSTNLSATTAYYIRVRAANSYGSSFNSNTITLTTAPITPTAASATPIGQTSFTAVWSSAAGATGYYLDVSTNSSFSTGTFLTGFQNLSTGNVSSYAVGTGVSAGSTYYYRIRSTNGNGISGNSNSVTVVTVPSDPVASAATSVMQSSFVASWSASGTATNYTIDVATDNLFAAPVTGWTNVDAGNATTIPVNSNLSSGTAYYYRVRSHNASGTSNNSNVVSLVTIPPVPVATAATGAVQTSFNANWNACGGATKYFLDVSASNTFASYVTGWNNLDVGNVTTYAVNSGLTAGTTYYFRVRASNGSGAGDNSNTTTITLVPPDPVAASATSISTTSFVANWNAASGVANYLLDVATDNLFSSPVSGWSNVDVGNVTTYSVSSNLNPGTTYYYRIRAKNSSGTSNSSGVITVLTAPGAPTAVSATGVANSSFTANWSSVAGATGYFLDVSRTATFDVGTFVTGFENLDVTNVNNYSVNSGLSPGTTYYYRVRTYNSGGVSGNSNTSTVATLPPSPVVAAASSISGTGFTANWNTSQ